MFKKFSIYVYASVRVSDFKKIRDKLKYKK